jgi:branched-chain amino acid transport system permease protein
MKNRKFLAILLFTALAILFQILFRKQIFWVHVMTLIFLTMILSVSLRLMTLTGLLNLSSIAFMGIGAYSSALLSTNLEIPFWLAMPLAGLLCSFLSFFLGFPLLRLIGAYFFIGTVTIAMITRVFFGNFFIEVLGGIPGFSPIARPNLAFLGIDFVFSSKVSFYYLAAALTIISLLIMYELEHSKYGRSWKAIAQADKLAESFGINLFRYKLLAFIICNFFCGITGAAYGAIVNIITPHDFALDRVFFLVMYCVVGGMASFWGPILGTLIMGIIAEFLRTLGQLDLLGYGIVLVLAVRFMPQGLIGLRKQFASSAAKRKAKEGQKQMAPV